MNVFDSTLWNHPGTVFVLNHIWYLVAMAVFIFAVWLWTYGKVWLLTRQIKKYRKEVEATTKQPKWEASSFVPFAKGSLLLVAITGVCGVHFGYPYLKDEIDELEIAASQYAINANNENEEWCFSEAAYLYANESDYLKRKYYIPSFFENCLIISNNKHGICENYGSIANVCNKLMIWQENCSVMTSAIVKICT